MLEKLRQLGMLGRDDCVLPEIRACILEGQTVNYILMC